MDCAHALWVVHTTKRLVSLMLLKGFIRVLLILRMNGLVACMDTVAVLPHAHIDSNAGAR